ncbi:electron transport protein [Bacillus sp. EB600]|uniref:electron transport protein n=1 Tax=Bacillus sp. EB600 TaxID=2806345 RepID=UPI0021099C25|nr:electron transport protein [Bacillus sp. EB600]MCQ6282908.1 electron transport protein [Bacillus sp. EB600]
MKKRKWMFCLSAILAFILPLHKPVYAFIPSKDQIVKPEQVTWQKEEDKPAFDLWGKSFSRREAHDLMQTAKGRELLSPKNGAVKIDQALLDLGRKSFYEETFGNEVFLSDILGAFNGPLTIENFQKAIKELNGKGTTNLQVELAETVTMGGKTYKKGTKVDTGFDVIQGSNEVLGLPIVRSEGRLKVGLSCAACHATVDPINQKVIEGAVNTDANFGLLLALGTNTTAYFARTEIASLKDYMKNLDKTVVTSEGKKEPLPDPKALEAAVDDSVIKWPKGNFDITSDFISNPTQIPDSFTLGDHPYSWSGFAMAGPFKGLSTLNNAVHAQGSDLITIAEASRALFGIDQEVYLGTILQNAANPKYRFDPTKRKRPSEFFAQVDPTPDAPGVNKAIKLPTYPRSSLISPNGLIVSSPGTKVGEQNNAMSAFQNTLVPPKSPIKITDEEMQLGKQVFAHGSCITCHAGTFYTNNGIIPVEQIGTEPSRAIGLRKVGVFLTDPLIYSSDTPVPVPKNALVLKVPTRGLDPGQINLAFGIGNTIGGYKVPSLIGLYWSAPYLHDGGVAVGADTKNQLGIEGTLNKSILPDPYNSIRALVDKNLRTQVIKANQSSESLRKSNVTGEGHEYWVDASTGFSQHEQDALIKYLLTLK